jgi:DNA-directed RNA polymerase beta' subunit
MSSKIKAEILDMTYDRDNNLFKLSLRDLDRDKHTNIAIKGTDWGVTPDITEEVVNKFCKDMIGQEKNLHIETEKSSLRDAKKDEKGVVSQEEISKTYENLDNYPIDEVMNVIHEELKKDED